MEVAGLTSLEAIRAGTESSALSVNGEGIVGAVVPGMKADLLVVNGDPSQDIKVLQDPERLDHIISRGIPHQRREAGGSWRLAQAQIFSSGYLTRDLVAAESRDVTEPDAPIKSSR